MNKNLKTILIFTASSLMLAGCCTPPRSPAWDYKVVQSYTSDLEQQLNQLNAQGWTVVSSSTIGFPPAESPRVAVILKRPKQ